MEMRDEEGATIVGQAIIWSDTEIRSGDFFKLAAFDTSMTDDPLEESDVFEGKEEKHTPSVDATQTLYKVVI